MVLDEGGAKGRRAGLGAWFGDLDRLLSGDLTEVTTLRERGLGISPWRLSACIVILGMIYGICMGTFAVFGEKGPGPTQVVASKGPGPMQVVASKGPGPMQVVASMVKVPLLFYLTLLVTLPSLYVFSALMGSRLSFSGVLRLLIASLGVNVTVLASLGPIVAFFSVCTTSYPFMVLFNVVVFAVAGLFGLRFLLQTLQRLTVASSQPPSAASETWAEAGPGSGPLTPVRDRPISDHVRLIFRVWVIVFGLVGAQMGWVLRPFIGNPNLEFSWFRHRESNFFMAVFQALNHLSF